MNITTYEMKREYCSCCGKLLSKSDYEEILELRKINNNGNIIFTCRKCNESEDYPPTIEDNSMIPFEFPLILVKKKKK